MLYDFHVQLASEWAASDAPGRFAKVAAGMARAGLFLIPYQCLDGLAETADPTVCPSGEDGADAVIDIDDDTLADDVEAAGVRYRETDYLAEGGPPPLFHVWTGPRYRLDGASGEATEGGGKPPPCNRRFTVDVARDPGFTVGPALITSPPLDADATCYGTWRPGAEEWRRLVDAAPGSPHVYYRATTHDAGGGNERSSLRPGAGLLTVPAPYAIVTPDGLPLY
jgi:hypothetical protein